MPIIGSDGGFGALGVAGVFDPSGRPLVSTSNNFRDEPLGIAPRNALALGLANATFELSPSDPTSPIDDTDNPLPYWSYVNNTYGKGSAYALYDTTTQTWGVNLSLGTAGTGNWMSLTTQSPITTDDNIALRQKAYLTMAKVGTYAGTTQHNLTLTATYYDHTYTAISTCIIGTALDNSSTTSISGFCTTGGSAISSSAAFVQLQVKVTATATVSSGVSWTLKSLLLATSGPTTQSFVVTQAFTASGTWTAPTGVTSVNVFGVGGGGGGAGGGVTYGTTVLLNGLTANKGAAGGGGGAAILVVGLPVTAGSSYSIGIGTAGVGGGGTSAVIAGTSQINDPLRGTVGGNGGATTFGSLLSFAGGSGGGTPGVTATSTGGAGGVITYQHFASQAFNSATGGMGGGTPSGQTAGTPGSGIGGYSISLYPYTTQSNAGNAGGTPAAGGSVTSGTTVIAGAGSVGAAGAAGFGGSGGGAAVLRSGTVDVAGDGGYGGGGGGGGGYVTNSGTANRTMTGGNGGAGGVNTGGGGGAGANAGAYGNPHPAGTISGGSGGNGGAGFLVVSWTA